MYDLIALFLILVILFFVAKEFVWQGALGQLIREFQEGNVVFRDRLRWIPFVIEQSYRPRRIYVSMVNVGFTEAGILLGFMFPFSLVFRRIYVPAEKVTVSQPVHRLGVTFYVITIEGIENARFLFPKALLRSVKVAWLKK